MDLNRLTLRSREAVEASQRLAAERNHQQKRLIQREIQDPLAMKLLSGEIADGQTVVVDRQGDALTLRGA